MIFNAYALVQVNDETVYFNFENNEWTRDFNSFCLTTKTDAEAFKEDLAIPSKVIKMNVSAVEASCQNCDIYNDIAHDCEFFVGYSRLDDLLYRAAELIERGTKQSTEGLVEGIKYDNDVKNFLKDYKQWMKK
jgi:hypothetical protein